jgi:L-lactate utilization protein LutC
VINEENTKEPARAKNTLISQFTEEITKVSGNVILTKPNELTDQVIDFLKTRKIGQIHLEPGTLDESVLEKAGIIISHAPDAALRVGLTPHVSPNWKETCGVTKAVCGLADTGSILIADGEGNPLQASLLPQIHIAVLCASDILPSLPDAMTLPIVRQSRASVVITGPSRTADIEMSLTIGMHGPGEVHVFLVDD